MAFLADSYFAKGHDNFVDSLRCPVRLLPFSFHFGMIRMFGVFKAELFVVN